jgi:hypothetical protein
MRSSPICACRQRECLRLDHEHPAERANVPIEIGGLRALTSFAPCRMNRAEAGCASKTGPNKAMNEPNKYAYRFFVQEHVRLRANEAGRRNASSSLNAPRHPAKEWVGYQVCNGCRCDRTTLAVLGDDLGISRRK